MAKWSEDKVKVLIEMRVKGHSFGRIAGALGVTRSSVSGMCSRQGLSGIAPAKPLKLRLAHSDTPKKVKPFAIRNGPRTPPKDLAKVSDKVAEANSFANPFAHTGTEAVVALKSSDCRWPIGDPRGHKFRFCCASSISGSPYCEAHHQLAYVPVKRDKKASTRPHHR